MDLKLEKVTLKNKKVKQMYINSFPKEERMPFFFMVLMSKMDYTDFWAFYDKDILCGFVYMAIVDDILFIMFFAVDENFRSKGYGSHILAKLESLYPNHKIIVTIEKCDEDAPNLEQRVRRKKFYLHNGYLDTGYLIELSNTKQEILIKNGEFDQHEFSDFFKRYGNGSMNPKIWEKIPNE